MAIGNIADQTRFLKKELRTIIEDTAADQEKKFEERFSKLERKLHIVAKGTDGAIQPSNSNWLLTKQIQKSGGRRWSRSFEGGDETRRCASSTSCVR